MRPGLAMAGAFGAAALAALTAAGPRAGHAHARLLSSTPAAGATMASTPAAVDLIFGERLEPAYVVVEAQDSKGASVAAGPPRVDPASPASQARVRLPLAPLTPGRYAVRYRVLSVDGHVVSGTFTFTVKLGTVEPGR